MLDRKLSGGIPVGSVVALSAPPVSQLELLLYELTIPRETLYLTTERPSEAVRESIDRTNAPAGSPEIEQIASDAPLDEVSHLVETVPNGATVIIDPVDALERRAISPGIGGS